MYTHLNITTVVLDPDNSEGQVFDVTGRCAFAICTKGEFEIKILNEIYKVSPNYMFACMPFVNIDVVNVYKTSEIVFGWILIKDVPKLINRWVNTSNLSAIQSHPLVRIDDTQAQGLLSSIADYQGNFVVNEGGAFGNICNNIQQDIIDLEGRLIVAKVLKLYFINISTEPRGYTPRDIEYQKFMLTLYANFREHRDVKFYAMLSGVSEKYFSTLIRQLSGSTPSEWIEVVVIGEAKTMLRDGQRSIKEIASNLNFPDAPTFTKYFQRVTGITPKAYRKSL